MARIFGRFAALVGRLRLAGKFALLAAIFAVPVAILTALLVVESQRGIHAADQERRGIEYIARLVAFLHAVQQHNVAIVDALADAGGARALDAATAAADAALLRVRAAEAQHGAELGSAERAQNLVDHWTAMKGKQRALGADRSLMEHRALSDGVVDLMYFVAERSRLLLDPQARSAYLQDVSVSRLPELVAALGQSTALMRSGTERHSGAGLAMAYQLAMKNVDTANRGFANAFGGSDVVVNDERFAPAKAQFEKSSGPFLEAVSARVRDDGSAPAPLAAMKLGTRALDDAFRLNEASLALLDGEIAARAAAERRLQLSLLGGVAASLAIAGLLLALLSRSITGAMREAMRLAGLISNGDLTQRIARRSGDEIGDLVDSLNKMSDRMTALVAGVKQSSDAVVSSAREVAEANADLSSRTERQASSLEEMAASTEELSATVNQSSGKIQDAGVLVADASRATVASNETMARAMETMRKVEESSRRIADISNVIDGIAFQTNILALNAAVEAARVGNEGRGFAVVAGEIRLLSQRSATAAREIKGLIAETVDAIAAGGDLVGEAGESLSATVETIRTAVAMMSDVTAMARQQGDSLEQISSAVMEMNGVTQQNASFVQQTSSIANRQAGHAHQLAESIGGFRIAAEALAAPEPAPSEATRVLARVSRRAALLAN